MFRRYGLLFSQGQDWISVPRLIPLRTSFTGMTTWVRRQGNFSKERRGLSFLRRQESRSYSLVLMDSKGISVIFLIIAMLLMVIIGYIFSYLIPSKQKSVVLPIQSTQAFFIAQSGVEFAVRYAADNGLGTLGGMTRSLGNGSFSLSYNSGTDTLTSAGQVPTGTTRRSIQVSNFTEFLGGENLALDPNFTPCLITVGGDHVVRFGIISASGITLDSFQSTWTGTPGSVRINYILRDGSTIWGLGNYRSGGARTYFSSTQTLSQAQPTSIEIRFSRTFNSSRGPQDLHVIFYSTSGRSYDLNLDPNSDGFPSC
jgi:hypothetical protein